MIIPKIGIIICSIREGRFSTIPAAWIAQLGAQRPDLAFEHVDLRDYRMPLWGDTTDAEPLDPHGDAVRSWVRKMQEFDGYIFVTAEYNHAIPSVLKNALDYLGAQMHRKPAAFVGYGPIGSARAIEQLRLILIEFQVAPLRTAVHIGMDPYLAVMNNGQQLADFAFLNERAGQMLDELAWWARALHSARTPTEQDRIASEVTVA